MAKLWGTLFLLLFSFVANATLYIPIPIEKQLDSSAAVIHGIYNGKSYARHKNGNVVTVLSFKVLKQASESDVMFANPYDFKVMLPGGEWHGLVHHVDGLPTFEKGEEAILLLSKGTNGMWLNDMALGKYSLKDGKLISSVFPDNNRLSNIPYDQFNEFVIRKFGDELKPVLSHSLSVKTSVNKFVAREKIKKEKRVPASAKPVANSNNVFVAIFLCVVVGGICGFGFILGRRN